MGLLDDFEQGTGAFGVTAMKNERQLARAIGPSIAHTLGALGSSAIAANASVIGDVIRRRSAHETTQIKDVGETLRQNLINEAQKTITGIQQTGANWRQKYGSDTALTGQKYVSDLGLFGKRKELEEGGRRFDLAAYLQRDLASQAGGIDPLQAILNTEGRKQSKEEALATPSRRITEEEEGPYNMNSLYPGGW